MRDVARAHCGSQAAGAGGTAWRALLRAGGRPLLPGNRSSRCRPLRATASSPSALAVHAITVGHGSRSRGRVGVRNGASVAAYSDTRSEFGSFNKVGQASVGASDAPAVRDYDFLVVGSGIAGLFFALRAAEAAPGCRIALITKADVDDGCTRYAQGGVCAVLDTLDSVESHIRDTMVAGAWLNDPRAVEVVCREGAARVLELTEMGTNFTRNADGSLHLTREGGHSNKRIVHAADMTGAEIERALVAAAASNPCINLYEHHFALDLVIEEVEGIRYCLGMDVLDQQDDTITRFVAPVTMLATGGAGQLYPVTTNPRVTTGDGIAMAYRASAAVANMEFVQFHPTAMYTPPSGAAAAASLDGGRAFLITEAVRGEGGRLYNLSGERFMERYDPERMELATRDIVARSIHDQLITRGDSHVLLDISHEPADMVLEHFPNIAARCSAASIDITTSPIPVVPAQHYFCGGVRAGLAGETSIAGLYAAGEVASTGLHGANRLASNSLLEGLVFGHRAVGSAVAHAEYVRKRAAGALRAAAAGAPGERGRAAAAARLSGQTETWVEAKRSELRELMWQSAGIVRSRAGLKSAFWRLAELYLETKAMAQAYGPCTSLQELHNLATVGELVISSALQRRESRGGHYVLDHPLPSDDTRREIIIDQSLRRRADLARVAAAGSVPLVPIGSGAGVGMGAASMGTPATPRKPARATRELSVRSSKEH